MSEIILKALMKLFALTGDIHEDTEVTGREKEIVRSFLARHLSNEQIIQYMRIFEEDISFFNSDRIAKGSLRDKKRTSLNSMRILSICEKINEELQLKQKVYVLVQLLDYISLGKEITENELDFLATVAQAFYISEEEYRNIKCFILNPAGSNPEKSRFLIIDNNRNAEQQDIKHLFDPNIKGKLVFLHITSTNTYILRYTGNDDIYLNGQNIRADQTYFFDSGSSIRGAGIKPVYYTEVVSLITKPEYRSMVSLDATGVNFRFRNSENGIHDLDFHEESGRLVGILGGSGTGKTTTLSILNGTLKPQAGEVLINGFNLYDETEKLSLQGVIGYVPQDDLLIEDLTVFQNLLFNAKMCMNKFPDEKIRKSVDKVLNDLDLYKIKDLKVGNPLKKVISGGQRKRVNIALELLREPTVLFVDEPTSGLSSVDSEMVMSMLKEQTYKGKLVIVNIHQPSSDIYKMFDKIMIIDNGGYQIFYGNPNEAVVYFKKMTNHANPEEDQCIKCGNIDADQILQIVEAKVVDEHGRATKTRKITPEEWADKFIESDLHETRDKNPEKIKVPENNYSIPPLMKQSWIFFLRDLLSKLADKQFILISLLGPPVLSLLLAYFTRYSKGVYKFSENENIPAYLFMCVITSLFFGLMVSAEEIVRDRKILQRESFLNLSWFSYLNSKIMILFIISAIQTLSFVLIGNLILEIKGMTLSFWLVLFTTSCAANILGLNISSAFNSVVTIYILIPFVIIPQLLFSGVLVKFDRLHLSNRSSQEYVPFIGDMMITRWSFEAMAVEQFRNNSFEKLFFRDNMEKSRNWYYTTLIPSNLKIDLLKCEKCLGIPEYEENTREGFARLNYHIDELAGISKIEPGNWKASLNAGKFNKDVYLKASTYFDTLKNYFSGRYKKADFNILRSKDSIVKSLGIEWLLSLEEKNENDELKAYVLNEYSTEIGIETPKKVISRFEPGYMKATSKFGRAHFYAPFKLIGRHEIDTYWFNVLVIWVVSFIFYLALNFNLPRRILNYFGSLPLLPP